VMVAGVCRSPLSSSVTLHGGPVRLRPVRMTACLNFVLLLGVCLCAVVMWMFVSVLAHQLDKNLQGRLTWTAGVHSSMNATLVWDREQHHVAASFQVCVRSSVNAVGAFTPLFNVKRTLS